MLRLWLDPVHIGLFPGHGWFQHGKGKEQPFPCPAAADPAALLRAFEKMLDGQTPPMQKGSRLALIVSDSIASIATLPWQEQLSSPAEIDAYARICFEKIGLTLGDNWVTHTEFRHYGEMGLAYALPRDWLEALVELIRARGHVLTAVLPATAAAYCKQHVSGADGRTLLLMQETQRCSAMTFGKEGLLGYDVEPHAHSAEQTRLRLLNRTASGYDGIARVCYWSAESSEPTLATGFLAACLPKAELRCLKRDAWN